MRGQFWIVPALITLHRGAACLRGAALRLGLLGTGTVKFWWLYSGDASTARDLLSSLLSGLITMTSLVVSLTFVILTLAANQLGPRLISIFMSDREIQLVLGLFIGTILYIILVLRTLNDTLGIEGVPHVAVTIASALTVVCLFSLLFYIHKIGRSIIADTVVNEVAHDVRHDLANLLPERDAPDAPPPHLNFPEHCPFSLGHSGYVQVIDYDALVRLAAELDGLIEVKVQAGDYVLSHGDHAVLHTHRPLEDDHAGPDQGRLHHRQPADAGARSPLRPQSARRDRLARLVARHQRSSYGDRRDRSSRLGVRSHLWPLVATRSCSRMKRTRSVSSPSGATHPVWPPTPSTRSGKPPRVIRRSSSAWPILCGISRPSPPPTPRVTLCSPSSANWRRRHG